LAGVLAAAFAAHWQSVLRRRQIELLSQIEIIAQMNDRIRNALQAIQCVDYAANSRATASVENAVRAIDHALKEVLTGTHQGVAVEPDKRLKAVTRCGTRIQAQSINSKASVVEEQ
jgi:hypothetical protein